MGGLARTVRFHRSRRRAHSEVGLTFIKRGAAAPHDTLGISNQGAPMPQNPAPAVAYSDTVVRQFSLAAVLWGVVGMLVGVFIAAQLAWPELNFGIPWLSYGRLRPLHTNAVI